MVAIKRLSAEQLFSTGRRKRRRKFHQAVLFWLGAFVTCWILLSFWIGTFQKKKNSSSFSNTYKERLIKHITASSLNAARKSIAKDIDRSLSCHKTITSSRSAWNLFCQAALEHHDNRFSDEFGCDATHASRNAILDIWSQIRSKLSLDQLHSILKLGQEYSLHPNDTHTNTYIWSSSINPIRQFVPPENIPPLHNRDKTQPQVFVDIGSQLGLTSLWYLQNHRDSTTTTKNKVISIEASPPNWLFQQLTFACQHYTENDIKIILAGPWSFHETKDATGKVYWNKKDSSSIPSWNFDDNDLNTKEFIIPTIPLIQLFPNNAEEDIILHWNCQGCEYNLLQFDDISKMKNIQMIGKLTNPSLLKIKPPYKRVKNAREIACQHPLIREQTLDCCAVMNDHQIMDCSSWIDTEEEDLDSEDEESEKESQWIQASSLA